MKIKYIARLIIMTLFFPIYSQDVSVEMEKESKNTEYREVNGLENWTYDYDISDLKDGKYNLIIRSRDKAGNISIDGPINIFVDSESDLPIVSISSPSQFMRVGGDILIVGTATDDDGISFVEVKLDDGLFEKAEGQNFWSSFLNIVDIEDGQHTLTARVTDINGLQGVETSVIINIDKTKPLITIDSHSNGEILSGRNNINGFVYDANGVSKLEYSLDGELYEELKLSGKAEHTDRKFSLSLDTRDNEGGTSYVRFRTIDGTGSDSSIVFVYYSDNEKPEINIISPLEDDMLNGFVTVTGTVSDEVGIASFSSTYGDDEDNIFPLITGNPYWSRTFDLRGEKSAVITFSAIDLSGNSEEYKLKLKLEPDSDKPGLSLIDFPEDQNIDSDQNELKGIAFDDDGVKSVEYSFDGGEFISMDTDGPFLLNIEELLSGKHTLELKAVDLFDISSDSLKYSFVKTVSEPIIQLNEYTSDKLVESFFDGVVFQQGKTAKISGLITGGEGDSLITYKIGNDEEKTVKASKGLFSITVNNKLDVGGHDVLLKAVDTLGREAQYMSRIYFAPQPGKDEEYIPVREDAPGLFLIDSRLENNGIANISSINPLTGFISGDTIATAVLDPPDDSFSVSVNGNQFTITPLTPSGPVSSVLKVTGNSDREYVSEELTLGSDSQPPILILDPLQVPVNVEEESLLTKTEVDENGEELTVDEVTITVSEKLIVSSIITNNVIISGEMSDDSEITRAEISFSGSAESYGGSVKLNLEERDSKLYYNQEIDLTTIPEGEHFLTINVEDILGNVQSVTTPFIVDRSAPELSVISPSSDIPVEGIITISGKINDFTRGAEVFFSSNGIDFTPVEMPAIDHFIHNIDLSAEDSNPELFLFRVIDKGRNIRDLKPLFNVDLESDQPKVAIEVPAADSTIRNDFSVTGLVFDDDAVEKIYYSLDGSEFTEIDGNFYYNIPFSMKDITDGKHTITVKAIDIGGFMSEEISSSFIISKKEPVSDLNSPVIEDYIKKTIVLMGETFDENGIDSVFISYDNGTTFNKASILETEKEEISEESTEGISEEENLEAVDETSEVIPETIKTVQWEYSLDTRLPGDGTHSILIKAIDGAGTIGISSTIINIDNTLPELKLDSPDENGQAAGKLIIDGKVFDGTSIKSVVSELKALDGEFEGLTKEIITDGVFRDIIDVSDYAPGWYNLNITVTDFADNSISETRNLLITPPEAGEYIDLLFPEEGKELNGPFAVEGRLFSAKGENRVVMKIDDIVFGSYETDETGLFSFALSKEDLIDGTHNISIESGNGDNIISSGVRNIFYNQTGPWVAVDNMVSGQFVSGRPMISGTAGYSGYEEEKDKKVAFVEISLDNGRVFEKAKGKQEWEFRLETYDLPEGENQLLIRAHFKDGAIAVSKLVVNVDESAPQIDLFTPEENKKFNENIALIGTASDENGLDSVEVLIREGSKGRYSVPSFIQGLYLDFHALGASYGEIGVGLSFFDDVVKLQAQIGLAPNGPQDRFTGIVLGVKLLATIVDIPFSYFFGYDWEFFSMSVAVGANFNYYSMSEDSYAFTSEGVVLGSVLLQYEFAKFEVSKWKFFNSYSFYAEGALWFISSDIEAGVTPTLSFGARIGIF